MILHAGLVARRIAGIWQGVLIVGPSGSGKSDLALRATRAGFRLVADDRVVAFAAGGRVFGRAPDTLTGRREIREIGVIAAEHLPFARIALRVLCVADPAAVERCPEPASAPLLGIDIPSAALWPFDTAAPDKLVALLEQLGGRSQQGYLARFAPLGGR
jgi:serine kinase of HPr protein (carbohydrate metabolism regulator)